MSDKNELDTRVVLMDANTGPDKGGAGREHIIGPHSIPYAKKDLDKDDNHFQFNYFCYDHNLCVGGTWFQHKESHTLTFYPNAAHTGEARDMGHVLIDGRSSSNLQDVRALPEVVISAADNDFDGKLPGNRAV